MSAQHSLAGRTTGLPLRPSRGALAEDSPNGPSRGRPRKTGWAPIEELIREMRAANPETSHMMLATDACNRVAAEFPPNELPAQETVLRHMKSILTKLSLHRAAKTEP